jgi:LysR family transcriptional regulator, transcriptional activator for dmlA
MDSVEAAQTLRLLVAVADAQSFSVAAKALRQTPSAVSKAVARAEARLGIRLVQRTTRRVSLTDVGQRYVDRGRGVLADLESVEREVTAADGSIRGSLRLAAPSVYGSLRAAPLLAQFQREHPGVDIDLSCDDRVADLVGDRIDVALRMVARPPAEFVARRLEPDRRGLYASPSYLRGSPPLRAIADLESHVGIHYGAGAPRDIEWRLVNSGQDERRARSAVAFSSNSVLAVREAARAGLGVAELPAYLAERDVEEGSLCEVLPASVPIRRSIFAVYLPSRYLPARTRAVVRFLEKALAVTRAQPARQST